MGASVLSHVCLTVVAWLEGIRRKEPPVQGKAQVGAWAQEQGRGQTPPKLVQCEKLRVEGEAQAGEGSW